MRSRQEIRVYTRRCQRENRYVQLFAAIRRDQRTQNEIACRRRGVGGRLVMAVLRAMTRFRENMFRSRHRRHASGFTNGSHRRTSGEQDY
jgi:hypothetical protein